MSPPRQPDQPGDIRQNGNKFHTPRYRHPPFGICQWYPRCTHQKGIWGALLVTSSQWIWVQLLVNTGTLFNGTGHATCFSITIQIDTYIACYVHPNHSWVRIVNELSIYESSFYHLFCIFNSALRYMDISGMLEKQLLYSLKGVRKVQTQQQQPQ